MKLYYLECTFLSLTYLGLILSCSNVNQPNDLIFIEDAAFSTNKFEVTVGEFKTFVETKNYISTADSLKWSGVFSAKDQNWISTPNANWLRQDGKDDFPLNYPVTQVSYYDACAYCKWKNGRLPSEQEWNLMAGDRLTEGNYWEGYFPVIDKGDDGYKIQSSPVGKFEANKNGLKDIYGNVWEWTSSSKYGQRIIKGGSFLCDINVCAGFTPGNHQLTPDDSGLNHLGFRCVFD